MLDFNLKPIERRAGGLKDILGELPKREASLFRSQVSKLASEAKKEKKYHVEGDL